MAVFEDGYKEDLSKEEGKDLVARAIRAGIYNDLGSGSNVDLCIITKDKVLRHADSYQSPVPYTIFVTLNHHIPGSL
jgi:20S proteasome subunit beta 2